MVITHVHMGICMWPCSSWLCKFSRSYNIW